MNTSSERLLAAADELLAAAPAAMAATWHRGAAFALRAALENAITEALLGARPQVRVRSMRAKLLCLRSSADAETARRARAAWYALCLGCHYHYYELGPTAEQLRAWHREVGAVIAAL